MRAVKKTGIMILIVLVAIQFIQPARNRSGQDMPTDISRTVEVSPEIDALLKMACYDCHSNNTRYPWYTYVQPVGWILSKHIRNGKKELNFSEFGAYSLRRQQSKLKSIVDQINDNAMPLPSYKWLHKTARLSIKNKALIIDWATKTKDSIGTGNQNTHE
jgi:hypothetical protein